MPLYDFTCEFCSFTEEFLMPSDLSNVEQADWPECYYCGKMMERDWTNNSISATVEGGTGGGAGMGLVSKMPPAKKG